MSDFLPWLAPYSGWTLMALMMLAGVTLALRGPRPRRSDGSPHCPRCDYNLTGLPHGCCQCPECGFMTQRDAERVRPALRWPWWIAGTFVALALPALVVQYRVRQQGWQYYQRLYPLYAAFPTVVTESRAIAGYRAQVVEDRRRSYNGASFDERILRIRRGSTTLFEARDWDWNLNALDVSSPPPRDLNNNGIEDLVVISSTGGAHCCGTMYIFELAPEEPKLLAQIDTGHGFDGFEDLNGDGVYEIILRDWTFAYWKTSFAGSPAPKVVLSWNGKTFTPNAALMRRPAPSPAELADLAATARDSDDADHLSVPLRAGLDLIYSGHAELAYDFLEQAMSGSEQDTDQFRRELQLELAKSPYRSVLEALGHPPLPRESNRRKLPANAP